MTKHVVIGLIFLAFLFFGLNILEADVQTKKAKVQGVASVIENNLAIARDEAISDALRKAVEQTIGVLISSETIVENAILLQDHIYTQASGYVRNYKVLSEKRKNGLFYITILAEVALGDLKRDLAALGLLHIRKHKPRIMVLIEDKGSFDRGWDISPAEVSFIKNFREKGFNIVDAQVVERNKRRTVALKALEGKTKAALAIGLEHGAEIIIVGKATARNAGRILESPLNSYQSTVMAKVIRVDTGSVITAGSENAAVPHIDDTVGISTSIEKASDKLAQTLISSILDQWKKEVDGATLVRLTISGLESLTQLSQFKQILESQVRGIENVYQRSYSRYGGTAILDLDVRGDTQSLARQIQLTKFGDFKPLVTECTQNTIGIEIH